MENKGPVIGPKTRIGEILAAWPDLENVLMDLSPSFRKLQNPVLRRTIGKVATLQQVAAIGNIPVHVIVNVLRKEVGQEEVLISEPFTQNAGTRPEWLNEKKIKTRFDAIAVIQAGENPMGNIFKALDELNSGEILLLITPFVPAPVLDKLRDRNCRTHTVKVKEEVFENYILKPG